MSGLTAIWVPDGELRAEELSREDSPEGKELGKVPKSNIVAQETSVTNPNTAKDKRPRAFHLVRSELLLNPSIESLRVARVIHRTVRAFCGAAKERVRTLPAFHVCLTSPRGHTQGHSRKLHGDAGGPVVSYYLTT